MKRIIIIDDKENIREGLRDAILDAISQDPVYEVEAWNNEYISALLSSVQSADDTESNADEDILYRSLQKEKDISLVVSDRDLSAFHEASISESAIADACRRLNIPLATYHRKPNANAPMRNFEQVTQIRSFSIAIKNISQPTEAARLIVDIARGFDLLFDEVAALKSNGIHHESPSLILSTILGKPELEYHFSQYAEGPSVGMEVFSTFIGENLQSEETRRFIVRKTAFVLGYWLYNYILNFPGVILNSSACASYLNISEDSFWANNSEFDVAKYVGPFGGAEDFWWRAELEELIFSADKNDGYEYLSARGLDVSPSKCCKSDVSPAGYYCLINRSAISKSASRGQLSWIPKGATLCRVEIEAYDALASMMSL